MKKLAIFLISAFLVLSIYGTTFAVPFQVGAGGYLEETVITGPGLLGSWTALSSGVFDLDEGEQSGDIDLFRISLPLAAATGTVDAYIELSSPNTDVDFMASGTFRVFSLFIASGGRLTWTAQPAPVSYTWDGFTNGLATLELNDIYEPLQCGSTFTISGRFTNNQDPSAPVPEPSTILLMGAGLLGLVAVGRRKFNRKE
jgi:hypothetical protein